MKRIISAIVLIGVLAALLCACGKEAKPLKDIYNEIIDKYQVEEMLEISEKDLKKHYGIDAADLKEFACGVNKTGVSQEEIIMIQANDADKAEQIAEKLNDHRTSKMNQQKNYNAEQYAIIEKSEVKTDGNYVSLFISENAAGMREDYEKAIGVK